MSSIDIRNLRVNAAQKFYDSHTLYIDAGAVPADLLKARFNNAITEVAATLRNAKPRPIIVNTEHHFNLVSNKNGESLGYAYLWVKDSQLYNILNGLNPDGSKRVKEIPNPDYNPTEKKISSTIVGTIPKGIDWAELDEEESMDEIPQTIIIPDEPLISIQSYTYTSADMNNLLRIHKYNMGKRAFELYQNSIDFPENSTPDDIWAKYEKLKSNVLRSKDYNETDFLVGLISVLNKPYNSLLEEKEFEEAFFDLLEEDKQADHDLPEAWHADVSGAYVNNVAEEEIRNMLSAKIVSKNVPTHNEIRKHFEPFVTGNKNKFPEVKIIRGKNNYGGTVTVTFDDKTRDAQFALYMNRKVNFPAYNCLLLFNIAKRSPSPYPK
jgi:hypothetical protein